jgi:putative acetyltransferase
MDARGETMKMENVVIRREAPEDGAAVREVNERAFEQPDEAEIVDRLRSHGKVLLSLVAVREDRVVGHILFTRVVVESCEESFTAVGLGPMAVLPELQKRGVGSLLVREGLDACRKREHEVVVLVGHPEYYPRFGFVPASRYGLTCEFEVPDEVFMAVELREGALAGRTGRVRYEPEFRGE